MQRLVVLALVAACAHTGTTDAGFRVFYPDAAAKLGKHFQVKPSATCKRDDGSDARWASTGARVESGALPPGLDLEDGALNGVPSQAGTFTARIAISGVTCASKPLPDQHVDVSVTVK